MTELKKCPFCGGEAELIEHKESCDGREDKHARIKCKCGVEMQLTFDEFYGAQEEFGYAGGYYSQNKKYWNGYHQKLIDKWNNRAIGAEGIPIIHGKAELELHDKGVRAKAIDEAVERLKDWLYENNGLSLLDVREIDEIAEQLKEK